MKQFVHVHGLQLRVVQVAVALAVHMVTAVPIAAAVAVPRRGFHRIRREHAPVFRVALVHAGRPVFIALFQ